MSPADLLFMAMLASPAAVLAFGPVLTLQFLGKNGWALVYAVLLTAAALLDFTINWDGITYPTIWARVLVDLPWLSFPILAASILFAFYRFASEPWRDK